MIKNYFPNLNGLRFIAAFAVIVHHTEQIKGWLGYKNYWTNPAIAIIGKLGVILFFVLSGFLITYLLLIEKMKSGEISIKKFYIRRILRIWPLYYLIVLLSFFVFTHIPMLHLDAWAPESFKNFAIKLGLFIAFLPNLEVILFTGGYFASHCWSVGVEEQFYLIWPWIIKKIKRVDYFLIGIIIAFVVIKVVFILNKAYLGYNIFSGHLEDFFNSFSIDSMAIGGIFAYYHFTKKPVITFIFNRYLQIFNLALLIVMILYGVRIPYFHYEFYSVLFGVLIVNAAANPKSVLNLENKVFNYLGKISYGLYVYHLVIIVFSIRLLEYIGITNFLLQYLTIITLIITVAGLSYRYYEGYFLKKKKLYS